MTAADLDSPRYEPRRDRLIHERVHDPYKTLLKLTRSTRCPECGALYHQGRWRWGLPYIGAEQEVCPACRRIADHCPAGILILSGPRVAAHKAEILGLIHNEAALEREEHPLHRIMDMAEQEGGLSITTTDIHLPRRLGKALEHAFRGDLDLRQAEGEYFVRVHWHAGR
ncbi:MAG TPA: BCAM0308 family protein [Azospirillum sp.]|nr:BCAM0308 family protein [Azospirillum sp.]